ncbi:hypothetical protein [Mucilaginibacter arboris]|uniref:DUF304 domain-containing protein n=1 Tax=Mucilaginibacter arboris TaxID=2682090 RepID=A0A7K1SZF7_9SPHI|nr:hypothetical protein [Mucilaginibacter arboris]MVN22683.1 hypothetical protein [Mucilaginibacter arboris]
MTNQLNLTHQANSLHWEKFWLFSKIFLAFLIGITLLSSFTTVPSGFYVSNMALCLLFVVAVLVVKFKRKQVPFIKIEADKLQYFCQVKKELVVIPVNEITNITTRFCELQIHTQVCTHCLNMDQIKQETQRWEIKEMIRKLAVEKGKRLIMADHNKAS